MSGIYWLASYPKSGNTWLRIFLTNYINNEDSPANINDLDVTANGFLRSGFDEWLGIDSVNLNTNQIEYYRPLVYEQLAAEIEELSFLKVHDAYTRNSDDQPIFSKKATAGAIYLLRNPLDIAVSYAHHSNKSIDKMIKYMASSKGQLTGNTSGIQLPQKLLSWSEHVLSWLDEPGLNICILKYEEMVRDPVAAFTKVINFCRLPMEPERIAKAVDFSSFEKLKEQEAEHGFGERHSEAKSFFRRGILDSWREVLTEEQIQTVKKDHHKVMARFGYLESA